ncbi:MAG: glycosyltransferase family 2 protein [Anaerolineales bacterium]
MVTLGIIIVSWNVRALLDRCLTALKVDLETCAADAEVYVVENASLDGSAALVRERHPWVQLVTPEENLGYVRGNNLILERFLADGMPDYVWLLNPDTEVQPGATSALLRLLELESEAGLAGPQLLNTDGSLQHGAFRFPGLLQPLFDLGWLPARFYESSWNGRYAANDYAKGQPFRVDHPLGAALMARGGAITQVGPLDERFFMYCEEIDWAWRMREVGWNAWMVPEAKVVHHGGSSSGQARAETTAYLWESRARLYRKHRGALLRQLVGRLVRRHFSRRAVTTQDWEEAQRRIVEAWQ